MPRVRAMHLKIGKPNKTRWTKNYVKLNSADCCNHVVYARVEREFYLLDSVSKAPTLHAETKRIATPQQPKLWFSVQAGGCHKSTSRKASMSQELTCSSLTTSNYSEWRSTQRFLSTSMSLMSRSCHHHIRALCHIWPLLTLLDAAKAWRPWRFPLLAVNLINVTVSVFYTACRRLTLIGYSYSAFKMS